MASGALTVGELVSLVLYLILLVFPLGQALSAWTTLQSGLGALQRVEEVRALPTEDDGDAPDGPDAPALDPRAPLLALDGVSFGYADAGPVLADVSFAVPRGTRTALVGPSGAGKSTVLALVERFRDVDAGRVCVGGLDVRSLPRARLRALLGYVAQEAPVLAGTLRDLLLAAPSATADALEQVVDAVTLRELVARAPLGFDSQVGDDAVLLSGGERQRLALARALLRAPALLLDEPTSNLDARNEAALRVAVDAVARDRTLLVVAHRLSTVVDADQIVVLDRGRVVAVGRHDELVVSSPLYRELAAHQLLVWGGEGTLHVRPARRPGAAERCWHSPGMRLAVCSSKGGVGKTATAANLAAVLATRGRTLAVDADPQDSLGRAFGVVAKSADDSLAALLEDPSREARGVVRAEVAPGLDLLPAHPALERVGVHLAAQGGLVASLRRVLRPLLTDYEHVVVDTHGDLGNLTLAAVCAADAVLTVFTSDPGSALGAVRVQAFLQQHRAFENTTAELVGVACSLWDRDGRAARDVAAALAGTSLPVLATRVPLSRRVPSATLAKRPVVLGAPGSPVAQAYRALADEVLAAYAARAGVAA